MKNFTFIISLLTILFSLSVSAQNTANYTITFTSVWESVVDNSTDGISTIDLPSNAHWSPLIGATHQTINTFFMMNGASSPGIESMAETGGTSIFKNEVETNSDADQYISGSGLGTAKGSIVISNITVNDTHPFISLVSMIAPSPDWFIGVNSMNLRSGDSNINDGWKSTFSVDLLPYDAGTEDGEEYKGNNLDSNPIGVISSKSNIVPFNSKRIGYMTFTYNGSTLSTNDLSTIEDIKIFPNPSKGNLSISNIQNIDLKTIEIYNLIGKLVKQIPTSKNSANINLNISDINNGIYLLKLSTVSGLSKTKKIVVNL
ncbi:MAG: spondin domain-containing protein [Algibacter sp.]